MTEHCLEEVINFGEGGALVGILSSPPTNLQKSVAIVIVNAGVLHRAGPCRASVLLARHMTALGYPVFRFDYSGIGDSGFVASGEEDDNSRELIAAFDELEPRLGVGRFAVHGLCSGARDAFSVALVDERVVAISQIDSYSYRTLKFYIKKILPKIVSVGAWLRLLKRGSVDQLKPELELPAENDFESRQWAEYPSRETIAKGYQRLVDRKVKTLSIYTSSWSEEYNYQDQFFDMYSDVDFGCYATLVYMPQANHVMSDPQHFEQFVLTFKGFMASV